MTAAPLVAPVSALMRTVSNDIVMRRFRQLADGDILEKSPGDLVTVADREAEVALSAGLRAILPEARILGEEASAADPTLMDGIDSGPLWIVDPIDGTSNFAAGRPPFAIMIAFAADGVTQAGWMFDPLRDRICHALKGGGAFMDGERIAARDTGAAMPVAALATHFMTPEDASVIDARAAGKMERAPVPKCAGEQYPRLVLGENDVALFHRTLPWDHAPGVLFLEEAGGRVAHPDGTPYCFAEGRKTLIAASSTTLWDRATAILFG